MRRWIARQMMRPWVYRIGCLTIFLSAMYWLRVALIALRETQDTTLAWSIAVPVVAACIAFGFWYDRRGY